LHLIFNIFIHRFSHRCNNQLQRIDRRFFRLPGLYRGTSYCFGSSSRYALAKNTSDRWRPGPGTGVSEKKMMKKKKEEKGAEKQDAWRCRRKREREIRAGRHHWRKRDERKRRAPRVYVDWKRTMRVSGSFLREERRRTRDWKRERVRRGNRWMGLAAYPANAPSDIAVTLLWRARGYDAVVVKSGISVRSSIRLSSQLRICLASREIGNRVGKALDWRNVRRNGNTILQKFTRSSDKNCFLSGIVKCAL